MSSANNAIAQDDTYNIPPHEIDHVLKLLWRDTVGEDLEAAVVQVRTLNLLIVIPEVHARPDVFRAIDTIAVQHPGRTITMVVTPDSQPPSAQVTIACRVGGSGKQICGEQITITSGDSGTPLPSIAASLLAAGVPTFFWWLGNPPFESALFDSFAETADRVIVDSRTWQEPSKVAPNLVTTIDTHPYLGFTDLQWTALTPWRRQTAQCFDLPAALPYLQHLTEVVIEHGPGDNDRFAVLLFLGWLASRLGWQEPRISNNTIQFQTLQAPLPVRVQQTDAGGALQRVELRADAASFILSYLPQTGCVKTAIQLPDHAIIERVARLTTLTLEQTVGEDLMMLNRDHGYEDALRYAAALADALLPR